MAKVPVIEAADTQHENRKERFSRIIKAAKRLLTVEGYEKPDPKPMAPPIGYKKQPSMMETMRAQVVAELARRAQLEEGAETEEEANDFDVDGDPFPVSPHEEHLDLPEDPRSRPDPMGPLRSAVAEGVRDAISGGEPTPSQDRTPEPRRSPAEPSHTSPEAEGGGERGSRPDRPPEPPPGPGRGRFFTRPKG